MRLYYFVGNLLRPFATVALYLYSYILRTPRTRLVVRNTNNEILLIQTWLSGHTWGLPGGGVERNEDLAAAALRELYEETGIVASENDLRQLFTLRSAGHNEVVFELLVEDKDISLVSVSRFEVREVAWHSLDGLPKLEPLAEKIIERTS